jgi:uncharacterized protein (DUF433 family)
VKQIIRAVLNGTDMLLCLILLHNAAQGQTVEEIEANFTGIDPYEQIMKALHEALEYERKSKGIDA